MARSKTPPRGRRSTSDVPAKRRLSGGASVSGPPSEALLGGPDVSEQDRRRERRLVEAACRGENSAVEALYRTHFDTIYRYVLLRLGSPIGS